MVQTQLRIDDDLHAQVKAAAAADKRSINGEILWLIELGLKTRDATTGTHTNR
jgi:hypothetical protein